METLDDMGRFCRETGIKAYRLHIDDLAQDGWEVEEVQTELGVFHYEIRNGSRCADHGNRVEVIAGRGYCIECAEEGMEDK